MHEQTGSNSLSTELFLSLSLLNMQIIEAGILPIAARLLSNLVNTCGQSSNAAAEGIVIISAALGVLINIAEGRPERMQDVAENPQMNGTSFIQLLCRFIEASL